MASSKPKTHFWVCSPGLWWVKSHRAAHPQLRIIGRNVFKTAQQNKITCWSIYALKCDQGFFFFSCSLLTFYCIKEEFLGEEAAACRSLQSSFSFGEELIAIGPNQDAYQEQKLLWNFALKQKKKLKEWSIFNNKTLTTDIIPLVINTRAFLLGAALAEADLMSWCSDIWPQFSSLFISPCITEEFFLYRNIKRATGFPQSIILSASLLLKGIWFLSRRHFCLR